MSTDLALADRPPQIYDIRDLQVMARSVAQSRLFPGIENEQAALTLMLLCQSEGLHPMQALRRFHVIKGRPSMRADAMQAEFQRQGGVIRWDRSDAEECTARFLHPVHAPEPGVAITLTMASAKDHGLASNDLYKKFPDQMLRARVISQGVRMVLPGVVVGIYTPEEVDSFGSSSPGPSRGPEGRVLESRVPAVPDLAEVKVEPPGRPSHDIEPVKFAGDRIGARGLDVRNWVNLLEQEVAAVNGRLLAFRVEHQLNAREVTNGFEVTRHLIKWAVEQGAEDPEPEGPDGKRKRVGIGKLGAHLHDLYQGEGWRDEMRRELRSYLKAKGREARQVAENEAFGDPPAPTETTVEPPADDDLVAAGAGETPEDWTPGRE